MIINTRNTIRYNKTSKQKGGNFMETEAERQDARKAMAYDLQKIISKDTAHETYTKEEIKELIDQYLETANQK